MKNQSITLDKAMKISIIVGALIIASSLAYYLIVFLPKKEATRIEEKKRAEINQLRDNCLAEVERNYLDYIKRNDATEERIRKSGLVPFPDKNPYNKNGVREECFKKYPQ